ncbi:hypothetical protein F3Y22_tig00000916pilonHSYRG00132 [Hibiscus syriacus]|uniref:Uncharacterized protein n=1 Tax=Hibiscus syriacus TaxID=106335 RepID=A0A6A3D3B6_HIBSY|nr:hypothetical protein F3Y22_tig00000916pilonHSYRG00132 [Hibiscus syriacus]
MALYGFSLNPCLESVEVCQFNVNLSITLIRPRCLRFNRKPAWSVRRKIHGVRCSSVSKSVSYKESQGNDSVSKTASPDEEEPGHVTRFDMSDFMVLDRVSVGLAGRADEVIFEAIVKDSSSPLYKRVVLRQLTSAQAQRRD